MDMKEKKCPECGSSLNFIEGFQQDGIGFYDWKCTGCSLIISYSDSPRYFGIPIISCKNKSINTGDTKSKIKNAKQNNKNNIC